jgi:hypothetical protein
VEEALLTLFTRAIVSPPPQIEVAPFLVASQID